MKKEFQAGYSFLERTGVKEKLLCECYVPVGIDKWYDQIKVSSEMNALLLQLYRKVGRREGVIELMDSWELGCVNNLIDRRNIACYYKDKNQEAELIDYFGRMHDFDITHTTATKMINAFIKKKIVKQINEKQRYRMYEYVPLMESIKKI